jgi:hypothetical protein
VAGRQLAQIVVIPPFAWLVALETKFLLAIIEVTDRVGLGGSERLGDGDRRIQR